MKIIEPRYEVLAPSPFGEEDAVRMMQLIELAGRTCYKSEERMTDTSCLKFIRMIRERGHESVLEHDSLSVKFVVDRGVSHELVRHRIASFSQESTRYCNYGKSGEVTFVKPCFYEHPNEESLHRMSVWEKAMRRAESAYLELLEAGAKPQEARSVLPNSLKTEVVTTANLREWRHILRLRTNKAAHPQIRQVMVPLLKELQSKLAPLFEDIKESTHEEQ